MLDVIGFGALNVDFIYKGVAPRYLLCFHLKPGGEIFLPSEKIGELEKLAGKRGKLVKESGGGSAANTVVALSRLGFKTGYIGIIGGDGEGIFLRKELEKNGVDNSHILQRKNESSGRCLSFLYHGERRLVVSPGANDFLSWKEIDVAYATNTRFLHLSSFAGEKPFTAQKRLVEIVTQQYPQLKISFSPGEIYVRRGMENLLPLITNSYLLFINQREIEQLTGQNFRDAGESLLKNGPQIIVCTRGKEGSLIFSRTEIEEIPVENNHKVIDPTGAGDVYTAGFLAGLLLNFSLLNCGRIATRMAGQSVKGLGRDNYPDSKDFEKILQELELK